MLREQHQITRSHFVNRAVSAPPRRRLQPIEVIIHVALCHKYRKERESMIHSSTQHNGAQFQNNGPFQTNIVSILY